MSLRIGEVLPRIAGSGRILVWLLVGDLIGCSMIYAVLEGQGPIASLWWGIVTASTVGYGDQYPHTTVGRGVGAFLIASWAVLYLCAAAQLTARLVPNPHLWSDDEQREMFRLLAEIKAASCCPCQRDV